MSIPNFPIYLFVEFCRGFDANSQYSRSIPWSLIADGMIEGCIGSAELTLIQSGLKALLASKNDTFIIPSSRKTSLAIRPSFHFWDEAIRRERTKSAYSSFFCPGMRQFDKHLMNEGNVLPPVEHSCLRTRKGCERCGPIRLVSVYPLLTLERRE